MTNYLLDTNIILRFTDTDFAEYDLINNAISQILVEGGQCFITSQVITEFWVVATRPMTVNGLGWTVEKTELDRDIIDIIKQPVELIIINNNGEATTNNR
ncbi:nuclease [Nostoc sp.]|uniref:nuclease n=1 Tax=Nostoc sp. TaxID=1180 RepID=UPI002FF4C52E